jgi:ATP-dependent helicase HrpB
LARVPVYEPSIGLTRLETVRVSRAAADQRRGRAGRTEPGVCYRLWEEAATGALEPFARPEILAADLAPLLLDSAAWGVTDPTTLAFLDPPPAPALKEARTLLQQLDALDAEGRITSTGRRLRDLPLPPRLARMVLVAGESGQARDAADVAAVLVERGLGGDMVDLTDRVERFHRDRSRRAEDMRRMADNWAKGHSGGKGEERSVGALLTLAYPDRLAKARGKPGEYLMANGRGASLEAHDRLAKESYLAIAEISGGAAAARILAAAPISVEEIEAHFADEIVQSDEIAFDRQARALRARGVRRLGSLVFTERPLKVPATEEAARALAKGLVSLGIDALPWSKALAQWRERVQFLRNAEGDEWPDLSDEALTATAAEWLAPHLVGKSSLNDIGPDLLSEAVRSLLPWNLQRRLDAEAPTHVEVPTGSQIPVDYGAEEGPVLAVRVQELFGLDKHPTIAAGRVPLILHLLSPAQRPLQITRDLPGFWRGSWAAVRADMRGQYPKHPWPEDPITAPPTRRAKPRGT